jgi:cytochrome c-type biogenesis protein
MELTLAAAFVAGLISFLSPCVLPVVPAYLGQLGATVAGSGPIGSGMTSSAIPGPGGPGGRLVSVTAAGPAVAAAPLSAARRRWAVLPSAVAFVAGFGAVFTTLGLSVYVGRSLGIDLAALRQVGGIILIVLGLNLAGVLRLAPLARSWRPLDRLVSFRPDGRALGQTPLGALGLGAIFAVGWTPCVGPTLGAILALASVGPSAQAVVLFVAYALGLAVPFLALAMALDRAPALIRPLVRHGRAVEIVGGALVVLIGLALLFDWLSWFAAVFSFLTPQV